MSTNELGHLGQIIEDWRDEQPIKPSVSAIAKQIGVTRSWAGKWMTGDAAPNVEDMRRLSRLLEVPMWTLMRAALIDEGNDPSELPKEA